MVDDKIHSRARSSSEEPVDGDVVPGEGEAVGEVGEGEAPRREINLDLRAVVPVRLDGGVSRGARVVGLLQGPLPLVGVGAAREEAPRLRVEERREGAVRRGARRRRARAGRRAGGVLVEPHREATARRRRGQDAVGDVGGREEDEAVEEDGPEESVEEEDVEEPPLSRPEAEESNDSSGLWTQLSYEGHAFWFNSQTGESQWERPYG